MITNDLKTPMCYERDTNKGLSSSVPPLTPTQAHPHPTPFTGRLSPDPAPKIPAPVCVSKHPLSLFIVYCFLFLFLIFVSFLGYFAFSGGVFNLWGGYSLGVLVILGLCCYRVGCGILRVMGVISGANDLKATRFSEKNSIIARGLFYGG